MDFQILGEETLKLKVKKVTLAVDPREKITKFDAEGILLTDKVFDLSRVGEYRVVIEGAGEYEVGGQKIAGTKSNGGIVYELIGDSANVLIARASVLNKIPADELDDYKIVVINVDTEINQTSITAMEPSLVILYGALKKEAAKKLGSESASVSSKISVSEEKLPEELEVLLLG
jgi:hypothetical protein